ncbi:unnamed protein product [Pleuronectes platessa]|uniref:C-type lectin domain-containing protein n=1 Tax=Pleuronectes platessa TaxID=8262 RepID=A0A9N7UTY0_PLEPL|nr:unnamed protein product [Pleuronectes platessa]
MKNGKNWHDNSCNKKNPFVCYKGTLEDSDFVLVNTTKTWSEAQRHCRENYTDLVTVRNDTDNGKIKEWNEWSWIDLRQGGKLEFNFL